MRIVNKILRYISSIVKMCQVSIIYNTVTSN